MRKVGAQSPTKIPKRSAWAWVSEVVPPVKNQMAIEPMIDTNPRTKQMLLSSFSFCEFIKTGSLRSVLAQDLKILKLRECSFTGAKVSIFEVSCEIEPDTCFGDEL